MNRSTMNVLTRKYHPEQCKNWYRRTKRKIKKCARRGLFKSVVVLHQAYSSTIIKKLESKKFTVETKMLGFTESVSDFIEVHISWGKNPT